MLGMVGLAAKQPALDVAIMMAVVIVGWPLLKVASAWADKLDATKGLDTALKDGDSVQMKHGVAKEKEREADNA